MVEHCGHKTQIYFTKHVGGEQHEVMAVGRSDVLNIIHYGNMRERSRVTLSVVHGLEVGNVINSEKKEILWHIVYCEILAILYFFHIAHL